jgi:hypothetical protein
LDLHGTGIALRVFMNLKDAVAKMKGIPGNFILKKCNLAPATSDLLKALNPQVNWNRVDVYEGLPWFTPFAAPYVTAQALPHFYSTHRFRIYLKKFDEQRLQCISDLVHEAFHVMQAMQYSKGYGLGFLRGWTVCYIAYFLKIGYRQNPFEIPAYDQEFRFLEICSQHGFHGIQPKTDPVPLMKVTTDTALVFNSVPAGYKGNFFLLLAGFALCLLITAVRPVADLLVGGLRLFLNPGTRAEVNVH